MGKAPGVPVAIVRGLDPDVVPRRLVPRARSARRPRTCSGEPLSSRPRVPRGAALDPRVHRRAGRARRARRARRGRVHRARAAPLAAVAVRRRRHRRRQGGARRRHGRALARRPRRRRRRRRRASTSSSTRRTRKITGAPALVLGCLTWDGLDRYPDDDPPARRVGHGAAVARRRGREPHARGRRRRARVVLGRGADLLPRGRPRRARAPRRVAPARAGRSSATPTRLRRPAPPAGPPRRPPRRSAESGASASARRWRLGTSSRVRARPSSSAVHGFQPRWISARPGSSAERCELAGTRRRVAAAARLKPVSRAIDVVELAARSSRRRCRC